MRQCYRNTMGENCTCIVIKSWRSRDAFCVANKGNLLGEIIEKTEAALCYYQGLVENTFLGNSCLPCLLSLL